MLRRIAKKAYNLVSGPRGDTDDSWKKINELAKKSAPMQEQTEKMNETLYFLHMVKNGQTVKTGEYEALTRLYNGQKIFVDTRDVSESPHLMLDGKREEGITNVFEKLVGEDTVFADIGANYGYFSLISGEASKKAGHTYLFEANPDLIPLLKKSLSVNGLTNKSTIVQRAVAESTGKDVVLHRYKDLWGGSSIHTADEMRKYRPIDVEFDKDYKVKTVTLDHYFLEEVKVKKLDLVKIDVEGVEDRVYDGMAKIIKKFPDMQVLLEFTFGAYKNDAAFYKKIMQDYKYVYMLSDQHGTLTEIKDFAHAKEIAEYEWIFLLLSNRQVSI